MDKAKLRGWFITVVAMVLVTIAAVSAVWLGLNKSYRAPSPFRVLPSWTSAVVRITDRSAITDCLSSTRYGAELLSTIGGDSIISFVARIDSLFGPEVVAEPLLSERDLYVSYSLTDDSITQLTASFRLNNRYEWHRAMNALKKRDDVSVADTSVRSHGLFVLKQVGCESLYLAAGGGCLFASLSPDVLVSFGADGVTPLHDDMAFSTIERTTTHSSPLSMYVNTASLTKQTKPGLFASSLLRSGRGSHWMAVDLGLYTDGMSADGFSVFPRPPLDVLMAAEGVSPIGLARRLPTGLRHFSRIAAGPRGLSSKAFCEYLLTDTSRLDYRSVQSDVYRRTNVDVEALLSQVFSAECALCSYSDSASAGSFLVVDTRGGTMVQASLTQALTALHGGASPLVIGEISPGATNTLTSRRTDAQQVGSICVPVYAGFNRSDDLFFIPYLFPASIAPEFNGAARSLPLRLFFRYEDAIVFADDMSTLRRVLVDYVLGNTMVGRPDFDDLLTHFSSDCNRFVFSRTDPMTGFGIVCRQLTMAGRMPYISLFAQTADDQNRATENLASWKIRLDSLSHPRLFTVTNHYTQLSECLLQDASGKINLIGADGMLLWRRAVDGPIVGEVSQIDYYDNHKLQYLFSSGSSLYIIDRLGNDVGPFPAHLHSRAVSGASPALYADGSPLRFFVGCEGGSMLYGPDGERVDGWNPTAPEGTLAGPAAHFVCGDKDYIVFHDQYSYYFKDRRGRQRLVTDPLAPSPRSIMTVDWQGTHFITTSADGTVVSIDEKTGHIFHLAIDSLGTENIGRPVGEKLYFAAGTRTAALIDITSPTPTLKTSWPLNLKSLDQVEVLDGIIALFDAVSSQVHIFSLDGREYMCSPLAATGSIALGHGVSGPVLFTISADGEILSLPIK